MKIIIIYTIISLYLFVNSLTGTFVADEISQRVDMGIIREYNIVNHLIEAGKMFKKVLFAVCPVAILIALLVQPCGLAYAEESELECWAVIVGIADYERLEDTSYVDDGAQELYEFLSPVWGQDHVRLLLNSEATKVNIYAAVDWLIENADTDDTVLFYFAGYGGSGGSNVYICPYDVYYVQTGISQSELGNWLEGLVSSKVIVILDIGNAGKFESSLSGDGRVILMSSSSNETAFISPTFERCVFTYYILQALEEFYDTNDDYELSAEEIFQYAEPETVFLSTSYNEYKKGYNIQHPVLSDNYPGELSLLVQCVFKTEPYVPFGMVALYVDDQPYPWRSPSLLWVPGSVHELKVTSPVDSGRGYRYVFTSWDDGDTSLSRTTSNGGVYTAEFSKEYQLTIESDYGEPEGEGWYQPDSTATISVASVEEAEVRRIFTGWSGDFVGTEATASVTMDSPQTVTVDWRTDYLLTIESDYGEPEGEGWYQEGSTATISVAPVTGVIIRHIFTGWSGDFVGTEATASVIMNSPRTITADWRTDYTQLYIIIGGIVVLGGIAVIVLMRRRT